MSETIEYPAITGKTAYRILSTDGADVDAKRLYFSNRASSVQINEFIDEAIKHGRSLKETYWMLITDNPFTNNSIKLNLGKKFGCY